jgi:major membrane immunogen (membrane-anchored lipoprotein)
MLGKKKLALILTLLFSTLFLSACSESASKKTVSEFLTAYQESNQSTMDALMKNPGTLGSPYVIQGLPESIIAKYHAFFVDFKYTIEREERIGQKSNVYVKITYQDAGTPSIAAFNDYQAKAGKMNFSGDNPEQIMLLLEETFTSALSAKLEPLEETIVVALERSQDGKWKIITSGEFQNALTSNMGVMVSAIEELLNATSTTGE